MPLLHVPPEPTPEPGPGFPSVPVPSGKRIVWTGPGGDQHFLSDGGDFESVTGRSGFGVVEADLVSDRAMSGTALLRDIRLTPRVMTIPLVVHGEDQDAYLDAHRRLTASLRHRRSSGMIEPGRIRVELPDGSWRDIAAYYQRGFGGVEDVLDDMVWARHEHPNLEFWAPDPHFTGPEISQSWRIEVGTGAFYPIYPIRVAPSQVGGTATVDHEGDAPTFPVWEVRGPGIPIVTNLDTMESWGFSTALTEGQTVTVDCRPPDVEPATGLTAVDDQDVDWWPHFAGLPELWLLPPGRTRIQVAMTGATEDSRIRLRYRPRWQTGW